jgi:hypothetical protein
MVGQIKLPTIKPLNQNDVKFILNIKQKSFCDFFVCEYTLNQKIMGFCKYQQRKIVFICDFKSKKVKLLNNINYNILLFDGTLLLINDDHQILDCYMFNNIVCIQEHLSIRLYLIDYIINKLHLSEYKKIKYEKLNNIQQIDAIRKIVIPGLMTHSCNYLLDSSSRTMRFLLSFLEDNNIY